MNAKDKIIKILKDFGKLSTSRIAGIVGYNYTYTLGLLESLEKEKVVKKTTETIATYWSLRKVKK